MVRTTRVAEAARCFPCAPKKQLVWFENSAHLPPHEEPGKFLVELVDKVRPLAVKKSAK